MKRCVDYVVLQVLFVGVIGFFMWMGDPADEPNPNTPSTAKKDAAAKKDD